MLDRVIEVCSPLAMRQLWQVTLTVALLVLMARFVGRRSAHWAYAILIVAALKCLCPPVWSLAVSPFCWWGADAGEPVANAHDSGSEALSDVAIADAVPTTEATETKPIDIDTASLAERDEIDADKPAAAVTPPENAAADSAVSVETARADNAITTHDAEAAAISWTRMVQGGLLALWITGSFVLMLGVIIKRSRLSALVSRGEAVTAGPVYDLVDRLRDDLGLDVHLNVVILDEPGVPGVFGVRSPTVVLPRVVLERMSPSELRLVLAHELNHLRRQDTVCGAVQLLAIVVWWFHPLVWWMNSHLRRFREHCCDEEVVARLSCRPGEYARCLLNVLSLKQELHPVVGVSALSPFDVTAQRLKNLMRQERSFSQRRSWRCVAASALLAFVLLPGAALPREAAIEVVDSPPIIPESEWQEREEESKLTQLYHSGIVEQELEGPAVEQEQSPPALTYAFQLHESPSYHVAIEADEPEGLVTVDGTIAWQVVEAAGSEITISRIPTAIVRNQTPRVRDGYFTPPSPPRISWHGHHGGPIGPLSAPRIPRPTIPQRPSIAPPGWPDGVDPFGSPRMQQGMVGPEHHAASFPGSPFAREPDRFSLAGGAVHLGDPCWLPYGIGDAIDWILVPLPAALDGGTTDRTFSWTMETESRVPHSPISPFAPTPEDARETATWQVVEQREDEWVLMREIDRWSLDGGTDSAAEATRQRLQGTALITWAVDLDRPRGIEFTGGFTRRAGGSVTMVPVTLHATLNE